MAIDNLKVIDSIGIDPNGNVVLSIADHLEWDPQNQHLLLLQEKINAYLTFIESGDLYNQYPKASGRNIVINVVTKYLPSEDGKAFLDAIERELASAGYGFSTKTLASDS